MTKSTKYRRSDVARLVMSRIRARPRANKRADFSIEKLRHILEAFGQKSVWSGSEDDLTVVRIDRTQPLSADNVMVVQVRETNRKLPADVLAKARRILFGKSDSEDAAR